MEYTRSVGDYYEYFEGTPQEISTLISALDEKQVSPPKIKFPDLSNMMRSHPNKIAKGGVSKGLKGGEQ